MLRRQVPLLLAVGWIGLLFAAASVLRPVAAGNGFTFSVASFQFDYTIEPFSTGWHRSPGTSGCVWDPDDHISYTDDTELNRGNLPAGYSTSVTQCLLASDPAIVVYATHTQVNITSGSPNLSITVSYGPPGRAFRILPVAEGQGFRYYACIMGPTWMDPATAPVEEFPDTNGGRGVRVAATVTVANPTSQTIRKTDGVIVFDRSVSCESGPYDYADPGFRWTPQVVPL